MGIVRAGSGVGVHGGVVPNRPILILFHIGLELHWKENSGRVQMLMNRLNTIDCPGLSLDTGPSHPDVAGCVIEVIELCLLCDRIVRLRALSGEHDEEMKSTKERAHE